MALVTSARSILETISKVFSGMVHDWQTQQTAPNSYDSKLAAGKNPKLSGLPDDGKGRAGLAR